jgi:hypothetical protein
MQIDTLMDYCQLARNLLGAPLNVQVEFHIRPDFRIYTVGITASLFPLRRLGSGLFGAIPTLTSATAEFATYGAEAPTQ